MRREALFMRKQAENTGMEPSILPQDPAEQHPELLKIRLAGPSVTLVDRDFGSVFNNESTFFANGATGTGVQTLGQRDRPRMRRGRRQPEALEAGRNNKNEH